MPQLTLNHSNPFIEFTLKSKNSYITIKSILLKYKDNNNKDWVDDFSKIQLLVSYHYPIYFNETFLDERKLNDSILLFTEVNQNQPIIHLNQIIQNDSFTIGSDPYEKFYTTLKVEIQNIQETYDVVLNIPAPLDLQSCGNSKHEVICFSVEKMQVELNLSNGFTP